MKLCIRTHVLTCKMRKKKCIFRPGTGKLRVCGVRTTAMGKMRVFNAENGVRKTGKMRDFLCGNQNKVFKTGISDILILLKIH